MGTWNADFTTDEALDEQLVLELIEDERFVHARLWRNAEGELELCVYEAARIPAKWLASLIQQAGTDLLAVRPVLDDEESGQR